MEQDLKNLYVSVVIPTHLAWCHTPQSSQATPFWLDLTSEVHFLQVLAMLAMR